jgi:hypothetical protein
MKRVNPAHPLLLSAARYAWLPCADLYPVTRRLTVLLTWIATPMAAKLAHPVKCGVRFMEDSVMMMVLLLLGCFSARAIDHHPFLCKLFFGQACCP